MTSPFLLTFLNNRGRGRENDKEKKSKRDQIRKQISNPSLIKSLNVFNISKK